MKARLVLIVVALAAALAIAGCAGGGDSSVNPASLAPPGAPVFIEATRPEGEAVSNLDSLAKRILGIDDLGAFIIAKIESSEDGQDFNYAKDLEPWLGDRAGLFLGAYDGDDFSAAGIVVQATDTEAASGYIEKRFEEGDEPAEKGSYEGADYEVDPGDGQTYGVIGNFFAFAEDVPTFKAMVDASDGKSLADRESYTSAIADAPSDAVVHIYADIGELVEEDGETIDSETADGLKLLGIEPKGATAVASLIPGSDTIEVDLSTDVLIENPPSGDASELLGSMPADSVAALASPEAGKALGEAVDRINREGIPSKGVKPREFKSQIRETGIDLDAISASIGDVAIFLEGDDESSLGGSVVLAAESPTQAKNTVAGIGLYLRSSDVPGVTVLSGKLSGFSVANPDSDKPTVIVAAGKRIAVADGLPAARRAVAEGGERTLAATPSYKEAVASLGGTPISGFVAGPAALRLASALIPGEDREGFEDAEHYLSNIAYLALGSESTKDVGKAKLIIGISE